MRFVPRLPMFVRRSMGAKLVLSSALLGSAVLLAAAWAADASASASLHQATSDWAAAEVKRGSAVFDEIFLQSRPIADAIAVRQVTRPVAATKEDHRFFADLLQASPEVVFGLYFASEQMPWNHPGSGSYVTRASWPKAIPSTYDYKAEDQEWYAKPKKTGKPFTSGAYYDGDAKITMVSCTRPVLDHQGRFLGVAGVDVDLAQIKAAAGTLRLKIAGANPDRQHAFVVDANGDLVHHLNPSLLAAKDRDPKPFASTPEGALAGSTPEGSALYMAGGQQRRLYWVTSKATGWRTALSVPQADLNAGMVDLRQKTAGAALLGVLLLAGLSALSARQIVRPLANLTRSARLVARGETPTVDQADREDEAGELARAFQDVVAAEEGLQAAAERLASGDLTVAIAPRSEGDKLGSAMSRMVSQWTLQVRALRSSSDSLACGRTSPRSRRSRLRALTAA